jgi:3-hydroxybutyryl-CoA dehydrogenase
MGTGIAESFIRIGLSVTVVEADPARAKAARDRLQSALAGADAQADEMALPGGRLDVVTTLPATLEPDLVIEAVTEDAKLKVEVLRRCEDRFGPLPVIATNTSALSIDELGAALNHPERFLGMHFFNPVPRSALVEIVAGTATSQGVVDLAREWVTRLGKESVVVRDSPGFATSRLGVAMGLEAIRMVEEGVASVEDIDRAMVLGYRLPVGPLKLTDIVGLDVRLAIAERLAATLGDRYTPPTLLRDKVARGELGRKTGRGFYPW